MVRNLLIAFMLGIMVASISGTVLAQDEEEMDYSWGIVSEISSQRIVLTEEDYAAEKEVSVVYLIDADIELLNVESLQDISVGDSAEIEFITRDGNKIAKSIYVETEPEEEGAEGEEYSM